MDIDKQNAAIPNYEALADNFINKTIECAGKNPMTCGRIDFAYARTAGVIQSLLKYWMRDNPKLVEQITAQLEILNGK